MATVRMSKLTVTILGVLIGLVTYFAYRDFLTTQDTKALDVRLKAITELEKHGGAGHAEEFSAAFNRAMLYMLHGQHEKAIPLFEKAVEISRRELASGRPELDASLLNLAQAYDLAGLPGKADPIYEELLMRPRVSFVYTKEDLVSIRKTAEKMKASEQQSFLAMVDRLPTNLSQNLEGTVVTLKAYGRHNDAERLNKRIEWLQLKEGK